MDLLDTHCYSQNFSSDGFGKLEACVTGLFLEVKKLPISTPVCECRSPEIQISWEQTTDSTHDIPNFVSRDEAIHSLSHRWIPKERSASQATKWANNTRLSRYPPVVTAQKISWIDEKNNIARWVRALRSNWCLHAIEFHDGVGDGSWRAYGSKWFGQLINAID